MKPIFEQITRESENSFRTLHLIMKSFNKAYHFHPELELTLIKSSVGTRFIGGSISQYETGDLVLVGENIPHCWLSEKQISNKTAEAIVIQFKKDFLGETIWELPEFSNIYQLLLQTSAGILVKGDARLKVISLMEECLLCKGAERIIKLIEILNHISLSKENELIDPKFNKFNKSLSNNNRFSKVFSYLIENYQKEITLEKISEIANMSPNAFCRYFKKITNKTFVEILIDFRINCAKQLLTNTEKSILEICNESGFGNLSYFNKKFKLTNNVTPLRYRKIFNKM